MVKVLRLSQSKIRNLLLTLDHIDQEKVTWAEFMKWLSLEGTIRNIAND